MRFGKGDPQIGVALRPSPGYTVYDVFVYRRLPEGQIQFLSIAELPKTPEGGMLYKWSDSFSQFEARNPPPVLQIPYDWAPQFAKAFVDEGFEMPAESFLKGQVDATQKHLEDMRRLVFKSAEVRD